MVTSEFDKESNRGRDASIVYRRGPVDDFFDEHVRGHGRHGRPQLPFGDHEIWESDGHAVEKFGQRMHVGVLERLLAALDELDDGNAIRWVEPRDLDHVAETIPPKAVMGR